MRGSHPRHPAPVNFEVGEFPRLRQYVYAICIQLCDPPFDGVETTQDNRFPAPRPRPASNRISLTTNDLTGVDSARRGQPRILNARIITEPVKEIAKAVPQA